GPAPLVQEPLALAGQCIDFAQDDVDVLSLLLERGPPRIEALEELLELRLLAVARVVEVEELLDLGKREAEAFTAQDELEANPVAVVVDAAAAGPAGRKQALTFVEPDGPRRQIEFAREVGNAE